MTLKSPHKQDVVSSFRRLISDIKYSSVPGGSVERSLQVLIAKYPHRKELKLKLMQIQRYQNQARNKTKTKRKK